MEWGAGAPPTRRPGIAKGAHDRRDRDRRRRPARRGHLERLAASAPELYRGRADVHLVDPYPAGAGRIWRHDQSPLLAMNSMAADVTMCTDESVVCEGPIRPGPSFWDWAHGRATTATRTSSAPSWPPSCARSPRRRSRAGGCRATTWAWVLRDVIAALPAGMRVHAAPHLATGLTEDGDTQVVTLRDGPPLRVDAVVLASGHLDATPTEDERALAERAAALGLRYLPPEQTTDSDLSVIEPGETVLVRGMGLAFVDLLVLLFEGRGGRFEPDAGRPERCATCRRGPSRGWSRARRAGRPTTPRRTTSCAPAARRCPGSSVPTRSTR